MSDSRGGADDDDRGREGATGGPTHLIVTVHGIRTFGDWQSDLKRLLEGAGAGIKVSAYKYGYFSALAFLVPLFRWLEARRFRKFLLRELADLPAGSRVDLVAHSFGTYLAASALMHVPRGRPIHTVIFAGSVLRPSFPWYKLRERGTVGRVVNECGWKDSVLVLCQFTALRMGMAGRVGFHGMVSDTFVNRYHLFGHGGYFDGRFMEERWVPLLTTDAPIPASADLPRPTALGGAKVAIINNLQFVKVAGAAAAALALVWIPIDWLSTADYKRRAERAHQLAHLANARHIPGRDPHHIGDLLQVDAAQDDQAKKTIRNVIAGEDQPDPDELESGEDRPSWWEAIPGLHSAARDGDRARRLHARANALLAAGEHGRFKDQSRAQSYYRDAALLYRRLAEDKRPAANNPIYGSYALCLMDYGTLLEQMARYDEAAEKFKAAREAFPRNKEGEYENRPLTLLVDSHCKESAMLQRLARWDEANDLLWQAYRGVMAKQVAEDKAAEKARRAATERGEAEPDPAPPTAEATPSKRNDLFSSIHNELAWLAMKRLDVEKAREMFAKAKEECERLVDGGEIVYKARLFNVRHGLAMAERLRGNPRGAYDQYTRLVRDIEHEIRRDFAATPKERRDLADRLLNSMERRADVGLFARLAPEPAPAPGAADPRGVRLALDRVEVLYQEAIERPELDDMSIKTRLLYKKVIAGFLRTLDPPDQAAAPAVAARPAREPFDVEFSEARRAFKALSAEQKRDMKIHERIASCCVELHDARRVRGRDGDFAQALSSLRALTEDEARRCEQFSLDQVEILLVACEILLDDGLSRHDPNADPDGSLRRRDASRMLAIIGASTKANQHGELGAYIDRFHRLAAARLTPRPDVPAVAPVLPPALEALPAATAAGRRFLQPLPPTRRLKGADGLDPLPEGTARLPGRVTR